MKLLVGIVTYQPNKELLEKCLKSVEGYDLFIHDNTDDNKGIAYGLRRIMEYAAERGYEYVLTLDQDSEVLPGLIDEYSKAFSSDIGALTCIVKDRNFHEKQPIGEVEWCITSGCMMSVEAYKKTEGYDESLFIDMVDMDICYSLRDAGYRIVCIPFVGLEHEVGKGKNTFLGISFNHEPWRVYYMVRNRLLVAKKHGIGNAGLKVIRDLVIITLFEEQKKEKLKAAFKGIEDSKR